jgi:hypothetical protein
MKRTGGKDLSEMKKQPGIVTLRADSEWLEESQLICFAAF